MHIRATDKDPVIAGKIVSWQTYMPRIREYLKRDAKALVFLATDSPAVVTTMSRELGARVFVTAALRSEKNIFLDDSVTTNYQKGEDILIDTLLLSRCSFHPPRCSDSSS